MFSKDKGENVATRSTAASKQQQVPSIISTNLRIVGNLISEGDVQVDGIIEGDVRSRTLTVSEGATVNGQIHAETVRIRGNTLGRITANNVELGPTAKVVGDIVHTVLSIESGAYLEGQCKHIEKEKIAQVVDAAGQTHAGQTQASGSGAEATKAQPQAAQPGAAAGQPKPAAVSR
ncbi:MAG: polymer-forming cytoskeletal protein [Alphaproteobacteria bacterium]